MKINRYPFSHGTFVDSDADAPTFQAAKDSVQVLRNDNTNFSNLKKLQDVFAGKKITNIWSENEDGTEHLLTDLSYKEAYRSIAHSTLTFTVSSPSDPPISIEPGEAIYYLGTQNDTRRYIKITQPYQVTCDPFIDKNGNLSFVPNNIGGNFYTRDIQGPMSNAIWGYSKQIDITIRSGEYITIPVSSVYLQGSQTIKMKPWDNYSIAFFSGDDEVVVSYQDLTFTGIDYYNLVIGGVKVYYIRLKLEVSYLSYIDNLTIRIY